MIISLFFIPLLSLQGQTKAVSQEDKVWSFTAKERDSMQIWFYNRATAMGLEGEKREEYYNIILYHTYKMARLDDKDKGYTPLEVRTKFDILIEKQHSEIKSILTPKQYTLYREKYDLILKSVFQRNGWEKK